ncbi:HET-domain-containing protein [Canariomyces notabilis]|uniref:HET-domain-containing protein n=1 Tax=Canariomyces notabilis TaxID=2074819 RepID=A0AAN6QHM5_9PEZI|nr:HET-domain-containing protein [Canariomyces arenarius]
MIGAKPEICSVCLAIPFESLPSEEETAIPHHGSLRELVASSSQGCGLCWMILLAIGDTCAAVKHERHGNRAMLPGGIVSYTRFTLPSGKECMAQSQYGNYMGGGNARADDGAHYRGPMYIDPLELFPGEEADRHRPWLFGNWWRSYDADLSLQLVGLWWWDGGVSWDANQDPDSPLRRLIPGRLRTAATSSATVKALCQEWMSSCNVKHNCAPPANSPLPTRVLDVANINNGQVRLVLGASVSARPYVALSHCWGTSHRITTKRDNVDAHMRGIPIANLPATFQQTVEMTHLLGISYLWIDSLCIIQDDAQDWEREASRMGDVYANANLVIAADSSTDDSSGCYTTIQERMQVAFNLLNAVGMGNFAILNLPPNGHLFFSQEWMSSSFDTSNPQRRNTLLYRTNEMGRAFDPIATENLSTRGWTLQERLLAARTLHLTKAQMYRECSNCMLAEDGAVFARMFPSWRLIATYATASSCSPEKQPPWFQVNPRIAYCTTTAWAPEIWLCLVEKYTARKLTNEKDKLPALSGLARRMACLTKDCYHAGLWRRHLLCGLAWRMHVYEPVHFCRDPTHDVAIAAKSPPTRCFACHPRAWRAPSWSWAAVDGPVDF